MRVREGRVGQIDNYGAIGSLYRRILLVQQICKTNGICSCSTYAYLQVFQKKKIRSRIKGLLCISGGIS